MAAPPWLGPATREPLRSSKDLNRLLVRHASNAYLSPRFHVSVFPCPTFVVNESLEKRSIGLGEPLSYGDNTSPDRIAKRPARRNHP